MDNKTKEKKIKISISIYESIHKEIIKRVKKSGMKLSPLIENLLMVWAYKLDESEKTKGQREKEFNEAMEADEKIMEKYEAKLRKLEEENQEEMNTEMQTESKKRYDKNQANKKEGGN